MGRSTGAAAEVVLSDGVVTLRPWRPEDAAAVFEACQDPEIGRHTYIPQPYELAHAEGFIAMCLEAAATGSTAAGFAIVDADTDRVLGSMSRPPLDGHRASFGYWLAPWARRSKKRPTLQILPPALSWQNWEPPWPLKPSSKSCCPRFDDRENFGRYSIPLFFHSTSRQTPGRYLWQTHGPMGVRIRQESALTSGGGHRRPSHF